MGSTLTTPSSEPFDVILTATFLRTLKRFLRQHQNLEPTFWRLVEDLGRDPFQPRLRLHPLRGALDGYHAVSLTYSQRVVLILKVDERSITPVNVGSHDEVYR